MLVAALHVLSVFVLIVLFVTGRIGQRRKWETPPEPRQRRRLTDGGRSSGLSTATTPGAVRRRRPAGANDEKLTGDDVNRALRRNAR
jgi:hypothetical protein